eukprot:5065914-Pyramimonas_sp.AAC.1
MLEKGGMQTSLIYTQTVRPSVATLERMAEGWMAPKACDPGNRRTGGLGTGTLPPWGLDGGAVVMCTPALPPPVDPLETRELGTAVKEGMGLPPPRYAQNVRPSVAILDWTTARRERRAAFNPGIVGRGKTWPVTLPPQRRDGTASSVCALIPRPPDAPQE